jgi:hypothetical protein
MTAFNLGVIWAGTESQGFNKVDKTTIKMKIINCETDILKFCKGIEHMTIVIPTKIKPPEVGIPPRRRMK